MGRELAKVRLGEEVLLLVMALFLVLVVVIIVISDVKVRVGRVLEGLGQEPRDTEWQGFGGGSR